MSGPESSMSHGERVPREKIASPLTVRWRIFLLGCSISGICLYFFVRQIEVDSLRPLLASVQLPLVGLATAIFLLEFVLRALRWRLFLKPLGAAPLTELLSITFVAFAANNLLFARSGELIRPLLAWRRCRLPLPAVVATTVMERIFDVAGLLTVFVVMTLSLPSARSAGIDPLVMRMLENAGRLLSIVGVVAFSVLLFLAAREQLLRGWVERGASWLPSRIEHLALRLYDGVAAGLSAFRSWRTPLAAFALSVVMWLNGALAIWIMAAGFGFELPFAAACFLSVALALAVIPPQAPGYVGVWQLAVSKSLVVWGVSQADASGFALIFWGISFIPVSLIGLSLVWHQGLRLHALMAEAEEALPELQADQGGALEPRQAEH